MNTVFQLKEFWHKIDTQVLTIQIIWLFHLTAILGVSIGFFDFFIPKTPLNLSLSFCLLIATFPIDSLKKILLTTLFFGVGMLVEWIGVHYDFLFGVYEYGENLGLKIDGVPVLIGIYWAVLVLITGEIANEFTISKIKKVLLGAFLMVLLDFLMEASAPIFDFWSFEGGVAPIRNYIAWFGIAVFLHGIFQWAKLKGDVRFCFNLYACQFIFFTYFYVYNSL